MAVLSALGASAHGRDVGSLRAANASLAAESRSAVLGLYALDAQLSSARTRLGALRAEETRLERRHTDLVRALRLARHDRTVAELGLAARLRRLYEDGEESPLDVLLGARSFDDAVTGIENIRRVAALDDRLLLDVRVARTRLDGMLRQVDSSRARLTVTARAAAATETFLEQAVSARRLYITQLGAQQALNDHEIAAIESTAKRADVRSRQLTTPAAGLPLPAPLHTPSASAAPATGTPVVSAGRTLTVSVTAYSLPGHTASGLPVGWGVAAVDPRLIPLGTRMEVPGYGEAVAADVGTAIIGARLDIWFPTLAQAQAWGCRTVTITID